MTDSSATVDHLRQVLVTHDPVYVGRLIRVLNDEVKLPDGATTNRELVQHPGSVCIVPVLDNGDVVMVRQWRHAIGGAIWELPAGTLDHEGEAAGDCAKRELQEETGYEASEWKQLFAGPLCPGYSSEVASIFLATGLSLKHASPDDDEQLDVQSFGASQLRDLIKTSEVDVKAIAGLALAQILPSDL
jgi:ADP-ribose pyrophosphatase